MHETRNQGAGVRFPIPDTRLLELTSKGCDLPPRCVELFLKLYFMSVGVEVKLKGCCELPLKTLVVVEKLVFSTFYFSVEPHRLFEALLKRLALLLEFLFFILQLDDDFFMRFVSHCGPWACGLGRLGALL